MSDLEPSAEAASANWRDRLKESCKGIVFGILLFLGGTYLLWWNEGRTADVGDAIAEAERLAVELPDAAKIDPAFDGRLVHACGRAESRDGIADPYFPGLTVKALSLRRAVQFYQLVEHRRTQKKRDADGEEVSVTTYSYANEWVTRPVTERFARSPNDNFVLLDVKGGKVYADDAMLGAYRLDAPLVHNAGGEQELDCGFDDRKLQRLQSALKLKNIPEVGDGGRLLWSTGSNALYIGPDPSRTRVGDVRVQFFCEPEGDVSVLAMASDGVLAPWKASNGESFFRIERGRKDLPQLIKGARYDNDVTCWAYRILGAIFVIAGLRMVLAPLSAALGVLPLLGNLAEAGVFLVSVLVGSAWSLAVVAAAWVRFRPTLACALLAGAAVLVALAAFRGRRRKLQASGKPAQPFPGQAFPGQPRQEAVPQGLHGQPVPPNRQAPCGQARQAWTPQNPYGWQGPCSAPAPPGGQPQQGWAPQAPCGRQVRHPGPREDGQG